MKEIQKRINDVFVDSFGRTPLKLRLDDIFNEAIELHRSTDLMNMKEEAGDLLCSLLQLANEAGWDGKELVAATLEKINRRSLQYKTLGRKTKVCILGGAFDPITIGHIKIAQLVLDTSKSFDEIWILPCFKHMFNKEMSAPEHRLAMARLACQVDGRIRVSDYEIANELAGETYHLVSQLLEEEFAKDEYEVSFIIGMDNANAFETWVNYEHLERLMKFVVVPRNGVTRDESVNWYLKPPHIYIGIEGVIPNVSSTLVRDLLRIGEDVSEYVHPDVLRYIFEEGLYGTL